MERRRPAWIDVFAVLCAIMLLVSACAGPNGASVTLRETDGGRTIELKRGDKLIVELEGNPTTGFSWTVASLESDVLKVEGQPEFSADPGMVGGAGTFTFTFTAARSGSVLLNLLYHQAWDKETPPAKTFEVTVTVE